MARAALTLLLLGVGSCAARYANELALHGVCQRPCEQWAQDRRLPMPAFRFDPRAFMCICYSDGDAEAFELGLPAGDSL